MTRESYGFRVRGIKPREKAFREAPEEVRRAYWRFIVSVVLELKDRSLAAGLDRFGEPMVAIAEIASDKGPYGRYDDEALGFVLKKVEASHGDIPVSGPGRADGEAHAPGRPGRIAPDGRVGADHRAG
jgi:hypothetical protein